MMLYTRHLSAFIAGEREVDAKVITALVGAGTTVTTALKTLLRRTRGRSWSRRLQQTGSSNFQAGGNTTVGGGVTFVTQVERTEGVLEVTKVGFTYDAELDVMVRNVGDTNVIIHKITIKKAEDLPFTVGTILQPTAKYHIPVDRIRVGQSKSLSISHVVPARTADRFLIALKTTSTYVLEVTLHYNKDNVVSFTKRIW